MILNLSKKAKLKIKKVEKLTSSNNTIQINMALNYGSRQEIINSLNKLLKKLIINEKNIQNNCMQPVCLILKF